MPNYAPLPPIELDPRNESELVAAAAQRVYEASGSTLNDFSSGSPVLALLEGQAFAQAEFLAFANSFPETVLVEWIGPFLGAQRRTGAGAVVNLNLTIRPTAQDFVVFPGFEVSSDPNLTGGQSISFVTADRLRIPPGETTGTVRAISLIKGTVTNVPPGSLTRPVTSLAGVLSVNNPEAAAGGQDPELLSEVKERFFSLIRRRNPVSAEDWVDFFSDALGQGTGVNVLPRRSERDVYRYDSDFITSSPAVSFFVINPDGSPLTTAQRSSLQNLLRFALPTEFEGIVYPMEVDDADVFVDLLYDPNKPYAQDLRTLTETTRNNLFGIMTPNAVFPVNYDPNVSDIESSLAASFPLTLGTTTQYIDPDIVGLRVYYTPRNLGAPSFTVAALRQFETGSVFKVGDIVVNSTGSVPVYYPVLEDFTPVTGNKPYHTNVGDLSFTIIQALEPGDYETGDVISVGTDTSASLHVVLASFSYNGNRSPEELVQAGLVSDAKPFTAWVVGANISANSPEGAYDPQIVEYERSDLRVEVYEPRVPTSIPLSRRIGYPVWVARQDFTVEANTSDLGTAQERRFVGRNRLEFNLLLNGQPYSAGDYVITPDPEQFITGQISTDACYVDETRGVQRIHAVVLTDFTFFLRDGESYTETVDNLVRAGIIRIVEVSEYIDCAGRPQFLDKSFKYRARFSLGEYLRYRPEGGFDAKELEDCLLLAESCDEVTPACTRLLEANLPLPRYFQALIDFTPSTSDPDELVRLGFVAEVDPSVFRYDFVVQSDVIPPGFSSEQITDVLVERGLIDSPADLVLGQTVFVRGPLGEDLGSYFWSFSGWREETGGIPTFRDMFRFAPGDSATFRNGSSLRQYEATKHLTPLADLETYFDNGVFVRSTKPETVKYYDPSYRYEDIIYDFTESSQKFYRVLKSFTPPDLAQTWAGEQPNSPRIEEVFGNLLKLAVKAECSERVFSRLGSQVSANKLGTATVKVTSKSNVEASYTYTWESTKFASDPSQLSYFPRTDFPFGPIDYGDGTFAL
jgi:hypothetical protein